MEQAEVQIRTASVRSRSRNLAPSPFATAWTAAVINYNGGKLLCDTVASIKQMEDQPLEVLVVDDGSTDDSLEILRRYHPDVRIVTLQHCGRPNAVRNAALQASRHRYVLLSDNDIRFAPDALRQLMRVLRQLSDAALCTPLIVSQEDQSEVLARSRPLHYVCWATAVEPRFVDQAMAAGLQKGVGCGIQLVDMERIAAVGTFDEELAFGWSDAELHLRLTIAGWSCYVVPTAHIYHQRARTSARAYGQFHNRWYIMLESYQLRTLALIAPPLLFFELLLLAYALRSGVGREYLRAYRDIFRELGEIRRKRREIQRSRKVPDREILCAADLELPRYLQSNGLLVRSVRFLSSAFRGYWKIVRPLL